MTTLETIKNGTTYNLSDGSLGYRAEEAGLGVAPLRRYSQRGPRQHGTTPTGFRLEPRIIQLAFAFSTLSWSAHYTRRDALMEIFTPDDIPISLRWTLPNGNVRQIDTLYNGGLDFATAGLGGLLQRIAIELLADDPIFYDPAEQEETLTHDARTSGLEVPTPVPSFVGPSAFDEQIEVAYAGTWEAYPRLRIYGPIVQPTIMHEELSLSIPLTRMSTDGTRASIPAHDYWDIELRGGLKTIVNSSGVSMIEHLADANDLTTFRLVGTTNTIRMTGRDTNANTALEITYLDRYIGL